MTHTVVTWLVLQSKIASTVQQSRDPGLLCRVTGSHIRSSEVTRRPPATAVTWHWDLVYAVFTWSWRYPLNTEVSRLNKLLNGRSKQEVGASSHSILNKLSCGPVDLAIYSGLLSAQPFPQNCSTQTLDCIHLVHVSTDILSTVENRVI